MHLFAYNRLKIYITYTAELTSVYLLKPSKINKKKKSIVKQLIF